MSRSCIARPALLISGRQVNIYSVCSLHAVDELDSTPGESVTGEGSFKLSCSAGTQCC
jgi:hypothetical protein